MLKNLPGKFFYAYVLNSFLNLHKIDQKFHYKKKSWDKKWSEFFIRKIYYLLELMR